MTQYGKALELNQTNFTIMDFKSLGRLSYTCNVSHYESFEFLMWFRAEKLLLHVPCWCQMHQRLEVPNLGTGEDTVQFNSQVANQTYDSMITKTREEALAKFGPSNIVLIVCAGWNAEGNQTTSMKEAFCEKQLSLCDDTRYPMNWAQVNSRCCGRYE